jgi:hypothetical protein
MALYIPGEGIFNRRFTFNLGPNPMFEEKCKTEFWDKHPEILQVFTNPSQEFTTWKEFADVIDQLDREYPDLILCSDNPSFDIAHISYAMQQQAEGHRGLQYKLNDKYRKITCTDSYLAVFMPEQTDLWVYTKKVLDKYNLTVSAQHNHYPESDAAFLLESFLAVLDYNNQYLPE